MLRFALRPLSQCCDGSPVLQCPGILRIDPERLLGLFGSPSLERIDGSEATGRAVQRHRMALLALLALAPSQRLTRDKLIAWLWPDSDSERGRNLLNVALYNLRKTLGESALLSCRDDLRLNAEVVGVDVVQFEEARGREDHAVAAALYRGPFLDGFFLDAAPEFEQWTERERRRLADVCAASLEALAGAAANRRAARHRAAAERAIALDPESADARVSFAVALWWQRDWPGAEQELLRALDLNPGQATARTWYSLLLRGMGRYEEAREQSGRAIELDPFALIPNVQNGWQSYHDRDYDRALVQYRRAIQIGTYSGPWVGLGLSHARKGQYDSGLAAVRTAIGMAPERTDFVADLAYVLALAGDSATARATMRRAIRNPFEPFSVARAWVGLGEADSAFAWLDRARWHWPHRATLSDPAVDPIRADPRFSGLAARVGRTMGLDPPTVSRFVSTHLAVRHHPGR